MSPFIPMQSVEAVHMGLVWKKGSQNPKILYHSRFPQFMVNDMADPELVDLAIERGALTTAGNQFNTSLRDVIHGFDSPAAPFLGLRPTDCTAGDPRPNCAPDDSFQRLTYGGYTMRQGLSQSVPTRIVANRTMERQLLFDIGHPAAFLNHRKYHTALLDEKDFALNRAAFQENGYSKGMFYNTYCNARVTLSDGRVYVFGGHDMQSDNGLYKVNIFDPNTETWVKRSEPCDLSNWRADPFGKELFARDPNAQFYQNCDPRNQQSTQPSDPSDQEYARWYPSAAPLPNDLVLVLGGFDQDGTVRAGSGPGGERQNQSDPERHRVHGEPCEHRGSGSLRPEDRSEHLARERPDGLPSLSADGGRPDGTGKDDWKVCTFNGEINYGTIESEDAPGTPAYRNAQGQRQKGGARFGVGGGTPPFTDGNTWCLDVLGALKDPNRDVPAKNHWTFVDKALEVRPYCCPTASLIELDASGNTVSHEWFMISGTDASGDQTGTVEKIDFTDAVPKWEKVGDILQPLATTKAVLLPDGKVLIGQGVNRSAGCNVDGRPCTFEEREGHHFQMFDPATGSVTKLAKTTVSRGLHGTATLLPDATVFFAGENREALVRPDDPSFPLTSSYAGILPQGDPDQGVPVGQVFSPAVPVSEGRRPFLTAADRPRARGDRLRGALRSQDRRPRG